MSTFFQKVHFNIIKIVTLKISNVVNCISSSKFNLENFSHFFNRMDLSQNKKKIISHIGTIFKPVKNIIFAPPPIGKEAIRN